WLSVCASGRGRLAGGDQDSALPHYAIHIGRAASRSLCGKKLVVSPAVLLETGALVLICVVWKRYAKPTMAVAATIQPKRWALAPCPKRFQPADFLRPPLV